MLTLSEPRIIERGPYMVVGVYSPFEGNDEGLGWVAADGEYNRRRGEVMNAADSLTLGFLYRPYRDHPEIPESVHACFVGAEVTDLDHVPEGMSTTQFPGGVYAIVECRGDGAAESAQGVGEAIGYLATKWLPEHGYVEGDACFAAGDVYAVKPPYIEYVYMQIERKP
jgi:DNA gyrase inhibitor GyrI